MDMETLNAYVHVILYKIGIPALLFSIVLGVALDVYAYFVAKYRADIRKNRPLLYFVQFSLPVLVGGTGLLQSEICSHFFKDMTNYSMVRNVVGVLFCSQCIGIIIIVYYFAFKSFKENKKLINNNNNNR